MALRITDEQWERIREHFPEENVPDGRPGRKPVRIITGFLQTVVIADYPKNGR